jgi:hypothetical protein
MSLNTQRVVVDAHTRMCGEDTHTRMCGENAHTRAMLLIKQVHKQLPEEIREPFIVPMHNEEIVHLIWRLKNNTSLICTLYPPPPPPLEVMSSVGVVMSIYSPIDDKIVEEDSFRESNDAGPLIVGILQCSNGVSNFH